jgi:hypothetical protein
MTCPRCKCPECAKAGLNAVLSRRIVSRAADLPRDLPFVEADNARTLQTAAAKDEWRDTFDDPMRVG